MESAQVAEVRDSGAAAWEGPGPGDPTPVPGGQVSPLVGIARACRDRIVEFLVEVVGELVLGVLATVSLALALAGVLGVGLALALLAERHGPASAGAVAVLGLGLAWLGLRRLRRARRQPTRLGRALSALTTAVGCWLLLCLGYASFGDAFHLAQVLTG
ncbi:hypothetical protein ACWEQL_34330 [Kitasatospora sp. NPDC004240]